MEAYPSGSIHSADTGPRVGEEYVFRPPVFFSDCDLDDRIYDSDMYDDGLGQVKAMAGNRRSDIRLSWVTSCLWIGVLLWRWIYWDQHGCTFPHVG